MNLTVKERIDLLLSKLNLSSIAELEKQARIGNGTIGKAIKANSLGDATILKIVETFQTVNRDFLKSGINPVVYDKKNDEERIKDLEERIAELKQLTQFLQRDLLISLNELHLNQAGMIALMKQAIVKAAHYRYGHDKKTLKQELEEINKIVGDGTK